MQEKVNKVGILIRALSIGGAEKQSLLLAKALKNDNEVFFFVQKASPKEQKHLQFIENEKINYIQLSGNVLSRVKQLHGYIKQKKIQALFSYLTIDNLLASFAGIFNKNLVVIGGIRNSQLPLYKLVVTWILHKFFMNYVLFNNESGKQAFLKKGFSQKKSIVIHNCFESKEIPEAIINDKTIRILTVGRFVAQKDYLTALKAFSNLQKMNGSKDIRYTIIGYGKLESVIRRFILKNNIKNVEIIINPSNLEEFYNKSNIYFCSSVFEGLSNTIMEALHYGLPVVATDVGDNNILVKDHENGFLCNPLNYKEMAEHLHILVQDKVLRTTFGNKSKIILINEFTEENFKNKYLELLDKII